LVSVIEQTEIFVYSISNPC